MALEDLRRNAMMSHLLAALERGDEWQSQQAFPICPDAADPDACNVYKDLRFPDHVYEHIEEYHEKKAEATRP